jgi:ribonuclease HI
MPFRTKSRTRSTAPKTQEFFGAPRESVPEDYLVAHIDGGARGNPGPAGYGVVIEDHAGRKLDEIAEFMGRSTNNVAEYSALLAALNYALSHRFRAVKILSDSELLVRQMRGEYKVRNAALLELYQKAKAMIRELDWFQVEHIAREHNREADRLANIAMDRAYTQRAAAAPPPAPAPAPPVAQRGLFAAATQEAEGIVRDGMVKIVKGKLPEGARVIVRVK